MPLLGIRQAGSDGIGRDSGALPVLEISQKRRYLSTSFSFNEKFLDYTFSSQKGTWRRQVDWTKIPSRIAIRTQTEVDRVIRWLIIFVPIAAALGVLLARPDPSWPIDILAALAALASAGLIIWIRHRQRIGFSTIPVPDNNIIVLHDRQAERIVNTIYSHRQRALLATATIDPTLSARENLRKAHRLLVEGIIDGQSFADIQRKLHSAGPLPFKQPLTTGPEQTIRQNHWIAEYIFEFHADYVKYQSFTLMGTASSTTLRYEGLPNFKNLFRFPDKIHRRITGPFLFLLIFIIWVHSLREDRANLPHQYDYGWSGIEHAALNFGLPLLIAIAAAIALEYWLRFSCTRVMPNLLVMIDKQHDRVIAELHDRRTAALRWYAEPDPLSTVEEHTAILSSLLREEVISPDEFARAVAQAQAVQASLSQVEPVSVPPARPGTVH